MKTHVVTILPENAKVAVVDGGSLLDAVSQAGIPIASVCGGEGSCGKCRVIVRSGKVTAAPTMFLSRRDIQRGVALACQTQVHGDVVIEVPPESRVGGTPKLSAEEAARFGLVPEKVEAETYFSYCPLSQKQFVRVAVPSLGDNTPDQERLFRELRWVGCSEHPVMQMGLAVLRTLPARMRAGKWGVTALVGWRNDTLEVVDVEAGDTATSNFGVAVDIGTTTVVAHLIDLRTAETVATGAKYNSQAKLGEDVISRLMYASSPERREEMHDLLVADINDLISGLILEARVKLHDITYVMCAGNTTMIHFLYGLDPTYIRLEPYVPAASLPPVIRAAEIGIGINPRGLLGTLPAAASYVGGDLVADVLVSGMTRSEELSLLVDMGTNGELVVGNSEWLMCASASAGPAFEGGGITCGMRATTGAIERVTLGRGGCVKDLQVIGGGEPLGLCGSGLIDLVGELLRVGCIDRSGRFVEEVCGSRLRSAEAGGREFVLISREESPNGREIFVTEADISNLVHTKGSIYMAAECLLEEVGLTFNEVAHVYVAGGFGNYLKIDRAIAIGLLPDLPPERFHFIGNGSVEGAKITMLSQQAMDYVRERIAGAMTTVELSANPRYMSEYSSCLFLPHTDIEKFPSVLAEQRAGLNEREEEEERVCL